MKAIKVFVNVPRAHADELRKVIGESGGGKIGKYSFCSFSYPGVGKFRPEIGAHPYIGTVGNIEEVEEERIEFICEHEKLPALIAAIKKVHPYEEPAIDAFEVEIL